MLPVQKLHTPVSLQTRAYSFDAQNSLNLWWLQVSCSSEPAKAQMQEFPRGDYIDDGQ
jgi:hypothetical protein